MQFLFVVSVTQLIFFIRKISKYRKNKLILPPIRFLASNELSLHLSFGLDWLNLNTFEFDIFT